MPQSTKYVPWLLDVSFSIYCALLLVTEEFAKERFSFLDILGYPLILIYRLLANTLGRYPGSRFHFVALWWSLAVIILVCLRILGGLALTRSFLCHIGGLVAVAGLPLLWLHKGGVTDFSPGIIRWLLLEVVVMVACVFLYLYRKWPTGAAMSILVLVLHFGLWSWATPITNGLWSIPLLLGICTALAWGFYVRLPANSDPPAKTAGA